MAEPMMQVVSDRSSYLGSRQVSKESAPQQLLGFINSINIAEDLDPSELNRIGDRCYREYMVDEDSRAEWMSDMDEAIKLASQIAEHKQYPWPNASNVKYPLITVGALQFGARAYPAIVEGQNVVKGQVWGDDRGVPVMDPTKPGEPMFNEGGAPMWQVPPGVKRQKADRVARHMSWQLLEQMPEWEDDTDLLMHVLPIVGSHFRKTEFSPQLGRNRSRTIWAKDFVVNMETQDLSSCPRTTEIFKLYPHEIIENQRRGVFLEDVHLGQPQGEHPDDYDAPHTFCEQHRLLDLDDDGYPEPYIVVFHKDTNQVMRITARYNEDRILVRNGKVVEIKAEQYYTHYKFWPNFKGGFYGIGLGYLLNPINNAINTTLNQMLDAGHLQVTGGGFISSTLKMKSGSMFFRPAEYKQVTAPGGRVADAVVPLNHPGPSTVLFSLLGLLIEAGKDISGAKDVLTGEGVRANEPATTTLARMEQGLKVYTAIFKRIYRACRSEFRLHFRLNAVYLNPREYFTFHDVPEEVLQSDYDSEAMDVVPVADPNAVADMIKIVRAEWLAQFMNDPWFDARELRVRMLDATQIPEPDKLIKQEPSPNPEITMKQQELQIEAEKADAQIKELITKSIEHLAKAEAQEVGQQLQFLSAELDRITQRQIARQQNDATAKQTASNN